MEEHQHLELKTIRDELLHANNTVTTTVNYSTGGIVVILGWIIESENLTFWHYFLPFFVIVPAALIIMSRVQTLSRLAAYQMVFLEKKDDFFYENKMQKFRQIEKGKLRYANTIYWLYVALGAMTTAFFVAKGYRLWWQIACYAAALGFYIYYYRSMLRKNWILAYREIWEKTKETN